MIKGLEKSVENNLDVYETIYGGVMPTTSYVTTNKETTNDELNKGLLKKLNDS